MFANFLMHTLIEFEFLFSILINNFLKSFTLKVSDTSASHETGVIAGSVIVTLVLLTTAIVLVYFARRQYKCTCEKSNVLHIVEFK